MAPDHLRVERLEVGELQTNCYLVWVEGAESAIIVDPGAEADRIRAEITARKLKPNAILLTHAHFDHCGAVAPLRELYRIPFYLHPEDQPLLLSSFSRDMYRMMELAEPPAVDSPLQDGERLKFDRISLEVIHTPGHTPGSVSFRAIDTIFTGDTLFQGSVGRTDLPGGSWEKLQHSLQKLMKFPQTCIVLPGHGEESTLAEEAQYNPFL